MNDVEHGVVSHVDQTCMAAMVLLLEKIWNSQWVYLTLSLLFACGNVLKHTYADVTSMNYVLMFPSIIVLVWGISLKPSQ